MRNRPIQLNETQRAVLQALARLRFATLDQLTYWVEVQRPAVTKTLQRLLEQGFVEVERGYRPHIYQATTSGIRAADGVPPGGNRYYSFPVMAHQCHCNAAEIRLRKHYAGFTFLGRHEVYKLGLSPAIGEHFGRGDDGIGTFVLLDDYLMQPQRITHSWQRPHTPNTRYFDLDQGKVRRWSEVASRFVVAATDRYQYERHKSYVVKIPDNRPALLFVEGLWAR
ncbi:MAG: hypothetical protein FD165_2666 [Gammaproteobacteria bacterium]|nr:MAG: hypothetical protein FD165_2666 [Gammaproteobacteria bacterium]TND01139.1 MAG: hypothetical protein FD120_2675 [Gammaproteobacteria bacterium]